MTFRAGGRKGTAGGGRQQSRVSIPGIGAATVFARLIEMPELVLGPHGTIEGALLEFCFPNAHHHGGSLTSLKEKLIKIGAKVVSHGRYVAFQMAEVAIPRILFADILRLVSQPRPPLAVAST
jgi:hypothetical protein